MVSFTHSSTPAQISISSLENQNVINIVTDSTNKLLSSSHLKLSVRLSLSVICAQYQYVLEDDGMTYGSIAQHSTTHYTTPHHSTCLRCCGNDFVGTYAQSSFPRVTILFQGVIHVLKYLLHHCILTHVISTFVEILKSYFLPNDNYRGNSVAIDENHDPYRNDSES